MASTSSSSSLSSQAKPGLYHNKKYADLPFPYPMLLSSSSTSKSTKSSSASSSSSSPEEEKEISNKIIWPFVEKGFALFYAKLDEVNKVITVNDIGAIFALLKLGFFGSNSTKEINHYYLMYATTTPTTAGDDEQRNNNNRNNDRNNRNAYTLGTYSLVEVNIGLALHPFTHDIHYNDDDDQPNVEQKFLKNVQLKNEKKIIIDEDDDDVEDDDDDEKDDVEKVAKKDHLKLSSLKLALDEAYFLSYVFGLLLILKPEHEQPDQLTENQTENVTKSKKEEQEENYFNLRQLWQRCCSLHHLSDPTQFATRYAAYHYFRSKGWIVRNGVKFGTDYLLYKEGPPYYHARYSVLVCHKIGGHHGHNHHNNRSFNWRELAALTRVTQSAHKEFLICLVTVPQDMVIGGVNNNNNKGYNAIINGPECIQHFTIDLFHLNRRNIIKGDLC